jgi:hypothetical protein
VRTLNRESGKVEKVLQGSWNTCSVSRSVRRDPHSKFRIHTCANSLPQFDLQKNTETAWNLEKCTCYQCPPRARVAGNDCVSTISDCVSMTDYNDWLAQVVKDSISPCPIHLFIFMGEDGYLAIHLFMFMGGDGGYLASCTKQCTPDVLWTSPPTLSTHYNKRWAQFQFMNHSFFSGYQQIHHNEFSNGKVNKFT